VRSFHRRTRNVLEGWARKVSKEIAELARANEYAIAKEGLSNLIKALRKLPKNHRTALIMLGYRRIICWIN